MLKHKVEAKNYVVDALNCKASLLTTLAMMTTSLTSIKNYYNTYPMLGPIYVMLSSNTLAPYLDYCTMNGFFSTIGCVCLLPESGTSPFEGYMQER